MSRAVPLQPSGLYQSAARVARPVATPVGEAFADSMAFLHGRCKAHVGSIAGLSQVNGDVLLSYKRGAADMVLQVYVTLNAGADATARATCNVTLNGSGTALTTSVLDGSAVLTCPTSRHRTPQIYFKEFDVSGLTVGTVYDLKVTSATSAGTAKGIYSVSAYVTPRDMLDPENNPSTDQGIAWFFPRSPNPLFAGSATTAGDAGGGFERYVYELDQRRKYGITYPLHLATVENDTYAFQTASAVFANITGIGTASFRVRATRLYTPSTAGVYEARIRYKSAGGNGTIRFATTPVGGATTNYDITLTTSAAYAWATGAVTLGTGGTNQEVDIAIQAKVAGGGTLYIDSIALYSNES